MRNLHHLTLNTGHVHLSPRSDVSAEAIAYCEGLIDRMIALGGVDGGGGAIEGFGDYRAHGFVPLPGFLVVIVEAQDGMCLAQFATPASQEIAARAWREWMAHLATEVRVGFTPPSEPPPHPWTGVMLEGGLALHPDAALWLGDFERCVAWAWIERHARHS